MSPRSRTVGILVASLGSGLCADGGSVPARPLPDSVRTELISMGSDDQAVREGMSPERMQDTAFLRGMIRSDSVRSKRLREIVGQWGWPDSVTAGPEAADAAFLILQHSPFNDFQEAMLPRLEAAAAAGAMPPSGVAMLVDRVLVQQGRPQRYGTQFSLEEGRLVADPVEDLEHLEERRSEMGLPSMDEYTRMLGEAYGSEVVGPEAVDSMR